jgi:hypothetical protein
MKSLLFWLSGRLPCRIISDGDSPYLERYYLFTFFGVRFYLHRFVASDPDRGLHDHPWPWAFSIILSSWYQEQRRDGMHKVRFFNRLSGDTFHRVILENGPVWTIFAHRARRTKEWGFLRDKGQLGITYRPHKPGIEEQWWKSVPRGRYESRRMSKGV